MGKKVDFQELRALFSVQDIEWRVGDRRDNGLKAVALPYVTARAVQDRLDSVLGPENWRLSFSEIVAGPVLLGVRARLELLLDGEWIGKEDGSGSRTELADRNIQVKGAYSDALKRAAVQWGVGRYLYSVPELCLPLNDRGEFSVKPMLPENFVRDEEKQEYFGMPYAAVTTEPLHEVEARVGTEAAKAEEVKPYVLTSKKTANGKYYLVEGLTQAQQDNFAMTLAALDSGKASASAVKAYCEQDSKKAARHEKWGIAGAAYVLDIVTGKVQPLKD